MLTEPPTYAIYTLCRPTCTYLLPLKPRDPQMEQKALGLFSSTLSNTRKYGAALFATKDAPILTPATFVGVHLISFSVVIVAAATWFIRSSLKQRHMTPGPHRHPLLGNLLQLPSHLAFKQFSAWTQEYGTSPVMLSFKQDTDL